MELRKINPRNKGGGGGGKKKNYRGTPDLVD